jgi:hypothetical protein
MSVTTEEAARHIVRIVRDQRNEGDWAMLQWVNGPFNIEPYEPDDVRPGLDFAINKEWIEVKGEWARVLPKGESDVRLSE